MSKVIAKDAQGQWKHLSNNKVVEALKVGIDLSECFRLSTEYEIFIFPSNNC